MNLNVKIEGETRIMDSNKSIPYGAGAGDAQMADLANAEETVGMALEASPMASVADPIEVNASDAPAAESGSEESLEPINKDEIATMAQESDVVKEPKIVTLRSGESPILTKSTKPTFDPNDVQNALADDEKEGGVALPRSGVSMKFSGDDASEGMQLKPEPDKDEDSIQGKFEVTGFGVTYATKGSQHFVNIRDYFNDLDTAFASVNGSKYLMPLPGGSYAIANITAGAPIICYNERELYNYKNNGWKRT